MGRGDDGYFIEELLRFARDDAAMESRVADMKTGQAGFNTLGAENDKA